MYAFQHRAKGNDGTALRFSTKPASHVRHRATGWIENQPCNTVMRMS
jgi:hypothetical protein